MNMKKWTIGFIGLLICSAWIIYFAPLGKLIAVLAAVSIVCNILLTVTVTLIYRRIK